MTVLSSFSKGARNAVGLSFAPSGSSDCDRRCSFHPARGGSCYAARLEGFRPGLKAKLQHHAELGPERIAEAALAELRMRRSLGESLDWLRITPFGPVPKPRNASPEFLDRLRELFAYCQAQAIDVHFPVESASKREFYQSHFTDLGIHVRQSVHSKRSFLRHAGPVAFTVGQGMTGRNLHRQRLLLGRATARERYEATGRKTVVCPHDTTPDAPRTRCGLCRACANPNVDVVYLLH